MAIYEDMKARGSSSRSAKPRLYLNGKFYSAGMNGVNRSADRLLRALDECAAAGEEACGWDIQLLLPKNAVDIPDFKIIRQIRSRMAASQFWEQAILPFLAADGVLLNLANFAPLLHRRKVTMVHDAQFCISPRSYSRRRRIGYRALIPAGARTSCKVLTVSDYARETLEMFGFAKRAHIEVIGNGGEHIRDPDPDLSLLNRLGLGARPFALMFGSPAIYKNVSVLFDAFNSRELLDIDLVIVGSSRAMLLNAGLSMPRRAIFAGLINDAGLRALYEGALTLLYPSRTEGFGLPPLEAMLCGCPVIATPAGAIPEVCQDAILYAGVDDPIKWIEQILRLARLSHLRNKKIADGLVRAQAYSWISSGRALIASIAPLLGMPLSADGPRVSETPASSAKAPSPIVPIPQIS